MKISYSWLKQYINTKATPDEIAKLLTDSGLEVESVEAFETVKGGLKGIVIGEVVTKEKHPDADKLSLTTVNVGAPELLSIVCGAPNVETGQKVVVATVGAKLYPSEGEAFEIKKSKIRGAVSEGMLCAEDEIGLGASHAGIMVLNTDAKVGTPAAEYFNLENDYVLEIGLTPNRADATSHFGVARDLAAVLALHTNETAKATLPLVDSFPDNNGQSTITVEIKDAERCQRYSGLVIDNITVAPSPDWLKNKLLAIGLRPINNVVDITNYVLHETGQPLHAFDFNAIEDKKIVVRTANANEKITTLDGVERTLVETDLVICDSKKPLCIAGVFGGNNSGVNDNTKKIFLESAYFNSVSVRKTSKQHTLKTDASFRFERGTDPEMTMYALKRAALLLVEVCGAKIEEAPSDFYPIPAKEFDVTLHFDYCSKIIGKQIETTTIKTILQNLGIKIVSEDNLKLQLKVPAYKVDVQREIDVIEEILRIVGYNNIDLPEKLNASLSFSTKPNREVIQNTVSDLLVANGFYEIMNLSLTSSNYTNNLTEYNPDENVKILNPLSSELDVMRQTLLFGGLQTIIYNINRKRSDLKLFEFGKVYKKVNDTFVEKYMLGIFITGNKSTESYASKSAATSYSELKSYVVKTLARLGLDNLKTSACDESELLNEGLQLSAGKKIIAKITEVKKSTLKKQDISQPVYYAEIEWDNLMAVVPTKASQFKELAKFPEVRRDLALLINKDVKYQQVEELAYQAERNLLKNVNLFDIYEGDKLEQGKKSYAVSFTLQDENNTLNDKQIEKIMEKLIKTYQEKLGATIR